MKQIAAKVAIASVRVRRDQWGQKNCKVEIARIILEREAETQAVAMAVAHMDANRKVTKLVLGSEMNTCRLRFFGSPTTDPSEDFRSVAATNFRLTRISEDELCLSFDFEVPLDVARRWLITKLGDPLLMEICDAQMQLEAHS